MRHFRVYQQKNLNESDDELNPSLGLGFTFIPFDVSLSLSVFYTLFYSFFVWMQPNKVEGKENTSFTVWYNRSVERKQMTFLAQLGLWKSNFSFSTLHIALEYEIREN